MGSETEMKIKSVVLCFAISLLVTVLALLLTAFWMYRSSPGNGAINAVVIGIYILSNFIGGFLIGKCAVKRRYLWGLGLGNAYFLLLVCASLIFGNGGTLGVIHGILTYLVITISGAIGGMLGN